MLKNNSWRAIIGLEIHVQLNTKTKLFSSAENSFGGLANSKVNLLDIGMPGVLPVLNQSAVEKAIMASLCLNSEINLRSEFDRKNYFYADLPLGYQITQFFKPLASNGYLFIEEKEGQEKKIRIRSIHLEQDAGKLFHDKKNKESYIDFNRCGAPLIEIVTFPDMFSSFEAAQFVLSLKEILLAINVCDCCMQEGSLRVDVNVSVKNVNTGICSNRVEIKNLNSIRFLRKAIDFEIRRQIDNLEDGIKEESQTRLFDEKKQETIFMRGKTSFLGYSYFSEPNLPVLFLSEDYIQRLRDKIPELPRDKKSRFKNQYFLSENIIDSLFSSVGICSFFERAVTFFPELKKEIANFIVCNLFSVLNKKKKSIYDLDLKPEHFGRIVDMVYKGEIASSSFLKVLEIVLVEKKNPDYVVIKTGLKIEDNKKELEKIVSEVVLNNSAKLFAVKSGDDRIFHWFVGQVMRKTGGKADVFFIKKLLLEHIEKKSKHCSCSTKKKGSIVS